LFLDQPGKDGQMNNKRRIMWNGTVRTLPLKEQLRAAAIARCEALSVTPSDYVAWLGSAISTRDMKAMAEDAGVRITHLDPFVRWVEQWQPDLPGEDFPTNAFAFDADDFFRMAGALGVESFTAWAGFPAGRYKTPQLIDAFGALCHRAAAEGLRCDLEFIPVFGIPNLRTAWTIVDGAGAANSGIVLDMWHYMRSGRDDALLSTIPGDRITAVQLCDATAQLPAGMSLAYDGLNNRRVPGDGEFPIDEIVEVLRQSGGLNIVGLEIFSPELDRMPADAIGEMSRAILDRTLLAAR
jgi:sugar phosphate isomerase/epimerase